MTDAPLLSSNDIAGAASACSLAIAWQKLQPRSDFRTKEIRRLTELSMKLQKASDHLNPYINSDDMLLDWGDDPIYGPLPASDGGER